MKSILIITLCFWSYVLNSQNWHKIYHFNNSSVFTQEYVHDFQFISPNVGYFSTVENTAGSSAGVADLYMTHNSGKDWNKIYTLSQSSLGTSCALEFDYLNDRDFFMFESQDGGLCHGKAFRDSVVVGTAFTPYPPPYIKNINLDTIIVSNLSDQNYIFMLVPNQENLQKIQIADNYIYKYPPWGDDYDLINSVCFISGFGAAIGTRDGFNLFYSSRSHFENWAKDTLEISGEIKKVYFANRNVGFIICSDSILYRTNNGGADWNVITLPQHIFINDIQFGSTKGYMIGNDGKVVSTEDDGITWELEALNTSNQIRQLSITNDIAYVVDSEGQFFTNNANISKIDVLIEQNTINIYPNPFKNNIEIVSKKIIRNCTVYNTSGLMIKFIPEINELSACVDLGNLSAGIYFMQIAFEQDVSIRKVVKN